MMRTWQWIMLLYLLCANLLAFCLCGADKLAARRGCRRVRESTLLFFAFIGGAAGFLCSMLAFRHKTKKPLFLILIPLLLLLQAAAVLYILIRFF